METLFIFKIQLKTSLHARMLTKGADIGRSVAKKKKKMKDYTKIGNAK